MLKLCLHYNRGIELKPLVRGEISDQELTDAIREAILKKPQQHDFENTKQCPDSDQRRMVQIGG